MDRQRIRGEALAKREIQKVYLNAYDDVATARRSLGRYFTFYNTERKHQALDERAPDDVHYSYAAKLAA